MQGPIAIARALKGAGNRRNRNNRNRNRNRVGVEEEVYRVNQLRFLYLESYYLLLILLAALLVRCAAQH